MTMRGISHVTTLANNVTHVWIYIDLILRIC